MSICANVKFRKPYNQFRETKNKLAKRASFKIVFYSVRASIFSLANIYIQVKIGKKVCFEAF